MRFIIFFLSLIFSSFIYSETNQVQIEGAVHKLNGLLTATENNPNKNIVLLVHGILGHQEMEIISNIRSILSENNIDSLSVNLSYGVGARGNSFFPCNRKHKHNEKSSIDEISQWYNYLLSKDYSNIYLLGHSRGALNVAQSFTHHNPVLSVKGVFLLAPPSMNTNDYFQLYKDSYGINLKTKMSEMKNRIKNGSEDYSEISFFHCQKAIVHDVTFLSYYEHTTPKSLKIRMLGFTYSTKNTFYSYPDLLDSLRYIKDFTFIFTASEDSISNFTYNKIKNSNKKNVELIMIDGSGHMFRDLYLEEVMDTVLEFILNY